MKTRNTAARCHLFSLIVELVAVAFVASFLGLLCLITSNERVNAFEYMWPALLGLVLLILPFMIVEIVYYLHYRNATYIYIQKVKLDQTDTLFRSIGLVGTVVVNDIPKRITTVHCFGAAMWGPLKVDQYLGKTLTVGFDPKWNKWVVLE